MNRVEEFERAMEHPAFLLWILRENKIQTYESLCAHFGPDAYFMLHYLQFPLHQLREAGLVNWEEATGALFVSNKCQLILSTLSASLSELAHRSDQTLQVHPLFSINKSLNQQHDVFVLMPFSDEMRPIYDDHIRPICSSLSLTVARADDLFTTNAVMADVWAGIVNAKLVIADCTGRNPNVFYEIGIAHTVGRQAILLTQSHEDIPIDIRHRKYIQYTYTPRGMKELESALVATIEQTLQVKFSGRT